MTQKNTQHETTLITTRDNINDDEKKSYLLVKNAATVDDKDNNMRKVTEENLSQQALPQYVIDNDKKMVSSMKPYVTEGIKETKKT